MQRSGEPENTRFSGAGLGFTEASRCCTLFADIKWYETGKKYIAMAGVDYMTRAYEWGWADGTRGKGAGDLVG